MKCLPVFNGFFYRVLPSFFGVHWGTSSAKRIYRVFTGFYRVFTGFYWVLPSFTGFYWVLPSFTELYRVSLACTWLFFFCSSVDGVLPSFTEFSVAGPRHVGNVSAILLAERRRDCRLLPKKKQTNKTNKTKQKKKNPKTRKATEMAASLPDFIASFFFKPNCLRFSLEFYRLLPSFTEF